MEALHLSAVLLVARPFHSLKYPQEDVEIEIRRKTQFFFMLAVWGDRDKNI